MCIDLYQITLNTIKVWISYIHFKLIRNKSLFLKDNKLQQAQTILKQHEINIMNFFSYVRFQLDLFETIAWLFPSQHQLPTPLALSLNNPSPIETQRDPGDPYLLPLPPHPPLPPPPPSSFSPPPTSYALPPPHEDAPPQLASWKWNKTIDINFLSFLNEIF